jgi:hypothetical protein
MLIENDNMLHKIYQKLVLLAQTIGTADTSQLGNVFPFLYNKYKISKLFFLLDKITNFNDEMNRLK